MCDFLLKITNEYCHGISLYDKGIEIFTLKNSLIVKTMIHCLDCCWFI